MHRAVTVAMVLALLAGSVPAAATLAAQSPSDTEPGASFAGVVGVQESEVNSEVASRSLDQRLKAAETNESKAGVVANESEQLEQRLAELEAEKERLKEAYENGSISKGQYQARLAVLSAELRAVERQANQTAEVAETLPEEALREKGANASEVRSIAQQANRTGGGEVAEAARSVAGGNVGNGLGNAPNASERGPPNGSNGDAPSDAGNGADAANQNVTDRQPTDAGPPSDAGNDTGAPTDAGQGQSGANQPADAANGSEAGDRGNGSNTTAGGADAANRTTTDRAGNGSGDDGSDAANRSTGGGTENDSATAGNGSDAANGTNESGGDGANESAGNANESDDGTEQDRLGGWTPSGPTAFDSVTDGHLNWVDAVSRTTLG